MLQLRILTSKGNFFFRERKIWRALNEHTAMGNEVMKIATNLEQKLINANMASLNISSLRCITEEENKDRRLFSAKSVKWEMVL